jgi:hypothetical protein
MIMSKNGIVLDFETADKIALASMKDQLKYLKKEVKSHEKKGTWMHPEDYHKSKTQLIPALETLILYYGGNV